jgi:hypothetical protein
MDAPLSARAFLVLRHADQVQSFRGARLREPGIQATSTVCASGAGAGRAAHPQRPISTTAFAADPVWIPGFARRKTRPRNVASPYRGAGGGAPGPPGRFAMSRRLSFMPPGRIRSPGFWPASQGPSHLPAMVMLMGPMSLFDATVIV